MSQELPSYDELEAISERVMPSAAFRESLGRRIVRLREVKHWSRADLAREMGISNGRMGRWERGTQGPPLEMLAPLARFLGVSADELLTGERPGGRDLSSADRQRIGWHLASLRQLLPAR
jgi:transcriptional regulator with XRE-family HTH domain